MNTSHVEFVLDLAIFERVASTMTVHANCSFELRIALRHYRT